MKRVFLIVLIVALLTGSAIAQVELSPDQIEQIARSVVMIAPLKFGSVQGIGSGTVIDTQGTIFTNRHVVAGGDDFLIMVLEDINEPPVERYLASLVGVSDEIDFAVLEIDRDVNGNPIDAASLDFVPVPLSSGAARLGEPIYVLGYPGLAEGYLVLTEGRISSVENGSVGGQRLPLWYQTDAEISPGNSGGLAINTQGQFIGMPTAVRAEGQTGGRLGGILTLTAMLEVLGVQPDQVSEGAVQEQVPDAATPAPGQAEPFTAPYGLDYSLDPNFGETELQSGLTADPFIVDIDAGGDIDTSRLNLGSECVGWATAQPDFRVYWSGDPGLLRFFFVGDGDTAMLINDPEGIWYCNDDSFNSLNPTIDIRNPVEGQYDIWVATGGPEIVVPGSLVVTEQSEIDPTTAQ